MLGWAGLIALSSLMLKSLDYGGGVDIWNVTKADAKRFTEVTADFLLPRCQLFQSTRQPQKEEL